MLLFVEYIWQSVLYERQYEADLDQVSIWLKVLWERQYMADVNQVLIW